MKKMFKFIQEAAVENWTLVMRLDLTPSFTLYYLICTSY